MKIITNYKDYYDHQANMYGGGDPKIVYIRPHKNHNLPDDLNVNMFKCEALQDITILTKAMRSTFDWAKPTEEKIKWDIKVVIVCNKVFTYIKIDDDIDFRIITENDYSKIFTRNYWIWGNDNPTLESFINRIDDKLLDVCKYVGYPVFSLSIGTDKNRDILLIDDETPRLDKLGIASYITPSQMYQEISYFVGNLLNPSPDMMPVININNNDKILSHGFDLKTSFRGK